MYLQTWLPLLWYKMFYKSIWILINITWNLNVYPYWLLYRLTIFWAKTVQKFKGFQCLCFIIYFKDDFIKGSLLWLISVSLQCRIASSLINYDLRISRNWALISEHFPLPFKICEIRPERHENLPTTRDKPLDSINNNFIDTSNNFVRLLNKIYFIFIQIILCVIFKVWPIRFAKFSGHSDKRASFAVQWEINNSQNHMVITTAIFFQ